MTYAETLGLVLMAAYGLLSLLLSILIGGLWCAWLESKPMSSRMLLSLRLVPSAGSVFLAVFVVLPAFLFHEPNRAAEPAGPLLMLLATFSAVSIGCGVIRAWRAWAAAATLLGECGPPDERVLISGRNVDVIDLPHGIVAVVGVCRPRIIAATGVLAVCSVEEVGEIIGHEAAHISAHDNLKLLLLIASPDMLAWTPAGKSLSARWRAAVEFEADATAAGADPWKRVTLASGLIKIARLTRTKRPLAELSMPIAADDVEGRVRRLLAPLPPPGGKVPMKAIVVVGVLTAIAAVPLYGIVQELIEALVACGR